MQSYRYFVSYPKGQGRLPGRQKVLGEFSEMGRRGQEQHSQTLMFNGKPYRWVGWTRGNKEALARRKRELKAMGYKYLRSVPRYHDSSGKRMTTKRAFYYDIYGRKSK